MSKIQLSIGKEGIVSPFKLPDHVFEFAVDAQEITVCCYVFSSSHKKTASCVYSSILPQLTIF